MPVGRREVLSHQCALADSGFAGDDGQAAATREGGVQGLSQPGELGSTAEKQPARKLRGLMFHRTVANGSLPVKTPDSENLSADRPPSSPYVFVASAAHV